MRELAYALHAVADAGRAIMCHPLVRRALPTDSQERARALATNVVSVAILILAIAIGISAIVVIVNAAGAAGIVGGVALSIVAVLLALGAWFFQIVPLKIADMEDEAVRYEAKHGPYEFKD